MRRWGLQPSSTGLSGFYSGRWKSQWWENWNYLGVSSSSDSCHQNVEWNKARWWPKAPSAVRAFRFVWCPFCWSDACFPGEISGVQVKLLLSCSSDWFWKAPANFISSLSVTVPARLWRRACADVPCMAPLCPAQLSRHSPALRSGLRHGGAWHGRGEAGSDLSLSDSRSRTLGLPLVLVLAGTWCATGTVVFPGTSQLSDVGGLFCCRTAAWCCVEGLPAACSSGTGTEHVGKWWWWAAETQITDSITALAGFQPFVYFLLSHPRFAAHFWCGSQRLQQVTRGELWNFTEQDPYVWLASPHTYIFYVGAL